MGDLLRLLPLWVLFGLSAGIPGDEENQEKSLNKALRRLVPAVFGVFAAAAVVAMAQTDGPSTEVKSASKHWVDEMDKDDRAE